MKVPLEDKQSERSGKKLKLSQLFSNAAPNKVFVAILLGSVAGIAYSLIIPLVLASLKPPPSRLLQENVEPFRLFDIFEVTTPRLAFCFLAICLVILVCRSISQMLLSRLAVDVTKSLRRDMYRRISRLPIQDLERIGPSRLMAAITGDIPRIINGAAVFPDVLVNLATLIGLLGFLIYLNLPVFVFVIGVILLGGLTYQLPIYYGGRYMAKARNYFDHVHESTRGLIYGAKELKINKKRRDDFHAEELDFYEDSLAKEDRIGQSFIIVGITYGNLISFFAIGCVTYVMANHYALSVEHLTGVVMVLLYITGPIAALINAVGPIAQASVALRKLQLLQDEMHEEQTGGESVISGCQHVSVKNLTYVHRNTNDGEQGFSVGPVDLELHGGEVIFLVGGNGSGKTTLAKMLSLHYIPQAGDILFDGHMVTNCNRETFRQNISAIYTDYFLFTKLFGCKTDEQHALANRYLDELNLKGKVEITNGRFSATSLSDGQKKRLALLVTYFEDRSIYVFDEWAADQDPTFRQVFYREIIPSLKAKGKLVIVISHDDRYFDVADKVLTMENGKVKSIEKIRKPKGEHVSEGNVIVF